MKYLARAVYGFCFANGLFKGGLVMMLILYAAGSMSAWLLLPLTLAISIGLLFLAGRLAQNEEE